MAGVVVTKSWRGIELKKHPASHRDYQCWVSEGRAWKAETYNGGKHWYARLLIGVHRFSGEGSSMSVALDKALVEAMAIGIALRQISDAMAR
jgi:hypothetical protein